MKNRLGSIPELGSKKRPLNSSNGLHGCNYDFYIYEKLGVIWGSIKVLEQNMYNIKSK